MSLPGVSPRQCLWNLGGETLVLYFQMHLWFCCATPAEKQHPPRIDCSDGSRGWGEGWCLGTFHTPCSCTAHIFTHISHRAVEQPEDKRLFVVCMVRTWENPRTSVCTWRGAGLSLLPGGGSLWGLCCSLSHRPAAFHLS